VPIGIPEAIRSGEGPVGERGQIAVRCAEGRRERSTGTVIVKRAGSQPGDRARGAKSPRKLVACATGRRARAAIIGRSAFHVRKQAESGSPVGGLDPSDRGLSGQAA